MIFSEEDLDFSNVTPSQFEELCFELLLETGYEKLIWRQGGADSGRDIEGYFQYQNPLVGVIQEKWFFESKCYKAGVPPEELNSKIAWADAEKPKHLVFFISSYLSNNARIWLEKIKSDKPYQIHLIEGKQLKQLLLKYPDIIAKYFSSPHEKLLREAQRNWLIHQILPDIEALARLSFGLEPSRLSASELVFFWAAVVSKANNIEDEEILLENQLQLDDLYDHLVRSQNAETQILSNELDYSVVHFVSGECEFSAGYINCIAATLMINISKKPRTALYGVVYDDFEEVDEGVEFIIEMASDFPVLIRYITSGTRDEVRKKIIDQLMQKKNN